MEDNLNSGQAIDYVTHMWKKSKAFLGTWVLVQKLSAKHTLHNNSYTPKQRMLFIPRSDISLVLNSKIIMVTNLTDNSQYLRSSYQKLCLGEERMPTTQTHNFAGGSFIQMIQTAAFRALKK